MRAILWILVAAIGIGALQLLAREPASRSTLVASPATQIDSAATQAATDAIERVQFVWARLLSAGWPEPIAAPVIAYSPRAWVHSQSTGEVIFGPHLLAATEDEIAFALAHELAHFLFDHHGELSGVAAQPALVVRGVQLIAEFEADARARRMMQLAGFNQSGIASYFERHARLNGGGTTHPGNAQRVHALDLSFAATTASAVTH